MTAKTLEVEEDEPEINEEVNQRIASRQEFSTSTVNNILYRAIELLDEGSVWASLKYAVPLRSHEYFKRLYEPKLKEHIESTFRALDYIDVHNLFPDILYLIAGAEYKNVIFYGPPNTGKSFTVRVIKEILRIPDDRFFIVLPDLIRPDFKSNVLEPGIKDGQTEPRLAELGKALEVASRLSDTDAPAMVFFEEIDQFPKGVLKQGNTFFEPVRKVHIVMYDKEFKWQVPASKLLVFAAFNSTGYHLGEDDTGALPSRWFFFRVPEIPREKMKEILKIATVREEKIENIEMRVELTDEAFESLLILYHDVNSLVETGGLGDLATPLNVRDLIRIASALRDTGSVELIAREISSRVLYRMVEGVNTDANRVKEFFQSLKNIVNGSLGSLEEYLVLSIRTNEGEQVYRFRLSGKVSTPAEQELFDVSIEPVLHEGAPLYLNFNMISTTKNGIPVMAVKRSNNVWQVNLINEKKGPTLSGASLITAQVEGTAGRYNVAIALTSDGIGVFCTCPSYKEGLENYMKNGSTGNHNVPCKHIVKLSMMHSEDILHHLVNKNMISKEVAEDLLAGFKFSTSSEWLKEFLKVVTPHMYAANIKWKNA